MLDKSSKGPHIACQKLTEHRDTLLRDLCMCWCAAAQQGLQEGDVSGPVTVGSALAGIQAGLWRALLVESAVRSGNHGEVSQVAHLLISRSVVHELDEHRDYLFPRVNEEVQEAK